jgi:membrane fusion protein, multidrug efflux system
MLTHIEHIVKFYVFYVPMWFKNDLNILMEINTMKTKILIILHVLVITFFGCSSKTKDDAKPKLKAPLVKVEELKRTSISNTVELTGTVESKVIANVISPADGYIEKLNVKENDFVRKDKQLAIIGSQERTSLLSQTKNKVEELQAQLDTTSLNGAGFFQLSAQLDQAKKELEYAEKLFLGVPVISPLSGTVTQKFIEVGSAVSARQSLFTIVDFNSLIIKSSVSENLFSKIKFGDKLKVKLNAFPEKEFFARVTLKYQQIDPSTRNFPIELKLINCPKAITPGMMALLTFVTDSKPNTVVVPNDAILTNTDGDKFVFVVNDSSAHKRIIQTGISTKDFTEVLTGVSTGEKLVTLGQELLKDSMKVNIQKPQSKVNGRN